MPLTISNHIEGDLEKEADSAARCDSTPWKKAATLRDGALRLLRVSGKWLCDKVGTARAEERRRRVSKHERFFNGLISKRPKAMPVA